jgi:methionine biosynthesis protein MetW
MKAARSTIEPKALAPAGPGASARSAVTSGAPDARDPGPAEKALRPDLAVIARWIPPDARVLDLGCGEGYGVEIDDAAVLSCVRRGVDVVQRDIEAGLGMFGHDQFDVVVLSMAIQATQETEQVLREMSQVGREGIVSFPNFGHWYHAWSILRGRMPVSREMPYEWFNTPNLHLATVRDFEDFLGRLGLIITARAFLANGRPVSLLPSLRSTQAIYRFRRAG